MAEPLNPPHRCRCPGVLDQYALITALNTCFNYLRGGPAISPTLSSLVLWGLIWLVFRSWALLGCILRVLLRLLSLLLVFFGFWSALGSILEPPGLNFHGFWDL